MLRQWLVQPRHAVTALQKKRPHTYPLIWRQVEASITLEVLHDIIQAVMGRFDCHLWEFTIGKQRFGLPMDDDWRTEPSQAAKARLRDVLNPRKTSTSICRISSTLPFRHTHAVERLLADRSCRPALRAPRPTPRRRDACPLV
jgi:hypothetical protein